MGECIEYKNNEILEMLKSLKHSTIWFDLKLGENKEIINENLN